MKNCIPFLLIIIQSLFVPCFGNSPEPPVKKIKLKRGTVVTLKLAEEIDSYNAEQGEIVKMELFIDVVVEDESVAKTGVNAFGKIAHARKAGMFGRGAVVELEAGYLQTIDGQMIPLKGAKLKKSGKSRKGLAISLSVLVPAIGLAASSPPMIIFAATGFIIKGKDVEIPSGTIMTAKIASDIEISIPGQ